MTATARIVDALTAHGSTTVTQADGSTMAQCPAHNDGRPSLHVSTGKTGDRAVLHCYAGCPDIEVLAALGLAPRDLFDSGTTYTYVGGALVHRGDNKTFRQTGNKRDRSLFRVEYLPDDTSLPVYVVEGEKDANTAAYLDDVPAVSPRQGASTRPERYDWSPLAGRPVVIVADNDDAGRQHAQRVAVELDGVAASVTVTVPAEGKDFTDHVQAGHGVDELQLIELHQDQRDAGADVDEDTPLRAELLPRVWRATDLRPAQQPRWLAKSRLPYSAVSLLVGEEGIGKSLLWVWLAAAVTTGRAIPEFGVPTRAPGNVLVVVTEDDWTTTVRPRLDVAGADLNRISVICTEDDGSGSPYFPRDMPLLYGLDESERPDLIVVDAWLDTVPTSISVRDPQQARQVLHPWKEAATVTGAAVLLLTHTNRVASCNARDKYGATGELRKKARMTLYAQTDDDGALLVGPEKANTTRPVCAAKFAIDGVQVFAPTDDHDGTAPVLRYVGDSDRTARDYITDAFSGEIDGADVDQWLAAFLAEGPKRATEVYTAADANGFSKDQAKRAKKRLSVRTTKTGSGPWMWVLPAAAAIAAVPNEQAREQDDTPYLSDAPLLPCRSERSTNNTSGTREHVSDTPPLALPSPDRVEQDVETADVLPFRAPTGPSPATRWEIPAGTKLHPGFHTPITLGARPSGRPRATARYMLPGGKVGTVDKTGPTPDAAFNAARSTLLDYLSTNTTEETS